MGRREGGMDGRARVFFFGRVFCFDRSEMVREKLLLVTCCTCYLYLL